MAHRFSVTEIESFLAHQVRAGLLKPEQERLRRTALKRLRSALQAQDPVDCEWILANADVLQERLAKDLRPASSRTYVSRAISTLNDYLAYAADPDAYWLEARSATRMSSAAAPASRSSPADRVREVRLDDDRTFKYLQPSFSLNQQDIRRIALHLWAESPDFGKVQLPLDFLSGNRAPGDTK